MEKFRLHQELNHVPVQASTPQKATVFPVATATVSCGHIAQSTGKSAVSARSLSDQELIEHLRGTVLEERRVVASILEYLREVDRRRLYADAGYPSLWEFCIRELGYSEGAASRRINSMRLLRDMPELKKDIEAGKHNLSSLAQAQKFFRTEEKHLNQRLSPEKKKEVLQKLENKTSLECEKELIQLSSVPLEISRPQKERLLDEKHVELKIVVNQQLMLKLKRVQALRSHASPSMNYSELLEFMADQILKRLDPLEKLKIKAQAISRSQSQLQSPPQVHGQSESRTQTRSQPRSQLQSQSGVESQLRSRIQSLAGNSDSPGLMGDRAGLKADRLPILESVRRAVWARDGGICGHRDPNSGRVCGAQHFLEIDHIQPVSRGGGNDMENLRLRCRGHNQRYAFQMLAEAAIQSK